MTSDLAAPLTTPAARYRNTRLMLATAATWHLTVLAAYVLVIIPILRTAHTCVELDCVLPAAASVILWTVALPGVVISLAVCAFTIRRMGRPGQGAQAPARPGRGTPGAGRDMLLSTGLTLVTLPVVLLADLGAVLAVTQLAGR